MKQGLLSHSSSNGVIAAAGNATLVPAPGANLRNVIFAISIVGVTNGVSATGAIQDGVAGSELRQTSFDGAATRQAVYYWEAPAGQEVFQGVNTLLNLANLSGANLTYRATVYFQVVPA